MSVTLKNSANTLHSWNTIQVNKQEGGEIFMFTNAFNKI